MFQQNWRQVALDRKDTVDSSVTFLFQNETAQDTSSFSNAYLKDTLRVANIYTKSEENHVRKSSHYDKADVCIFKSQSVVMNGQVAGWQVCALNGYWLSAHFQLRIY